MCSSVRATRTESEMLFVFTDYLIDGSTHLLSTARHCLSHRGRHEPVAECKFIDRKVIAINDWQSE
jgi:hypothetical protein